MTYDEYLRHIASLTNFELKKHLQALTNELPQHDRLSFRYNSILQQIGDVRQLQIQRKEKQADLTLF